MKIILIILGSVFVFLAVIGIFLPGLPTTPFLLLASGCYIKSSDRLYNWLIKQKTLGKYIKDFNEKKTIPLKTKIYSIILMWIMISISVIFFLDPLIIKIFLILVGITGTIVMGRIKNA